MTGKFPRVPKVPLAMVDVRDMATAHINAIEKGKNGTRYLTNRKDAYFFMEVVKPLIEEFKGKIYKIPTKEAPYWMMRLASICDKSIKPMLPFYNLPYSVDTRKSTEELGLTYRPIEESAIEMAHNLIDLGYMEDLRNK